MKNLLNNLLNWVLKKGPSETKKDQAWEEKEQAGSKKEQAGSKKEQVKRTKLSEKGTSLEKRTKLKMGSEVREVMGSEAVSANHALITQLSRNNHPISLRAIRYAAVLFMVFMVGIGQAWGVDITVTRFALNGTTIYAINQDNKMFHDEVEFTLSTKPSLSSNLLSVPESSVLTIGAHGKTITKIVIEWSSANNSSTFSSGSATWKNSNKTMTWTGSTTSLAITSGAASRVNSAVITYTDADPLSGVSTTTLSSFSRIYSSSGACMYSSKTNSAYGVNIQGALDSNNPVGLSKNASNSLFTNGLRLVSPKPISSVVYTWTVAPTTASVSSGTYNSSTSTWTAPNTTTTEVTIFNNGTGTAKFSQIVVNFVGSTPSCTSHSVSLSSSGSVTGGTFTTSSATVCEGETATLTATPAAGYVFTSWSASGTGSSLSSTTTNPTTLTMGTADVSVNATFTKVYASGTYTFYGNTTVGSSPSKTVTTTATDYDAFRIDNLFFSSTNIQYESGSGSTESNDYYGWKVKMSSTIKFFVEDDSDVKICIGTIGGGTCTVSYTDHSSVAHNNTSISSGSHETYEVKGGTMVTLSMAPSSTKSVTLKQIMITPSVSCTAPNHVDISGRWDYFGGETINLTATAYDDGDAEIAAGSITGYQWKHNGVDIAGATSKTFTKSNCTVDDAGDYSCVVSTGATCSTESSLYGTKVYVLQQYIGGETTYNFTRTGSSQAGTVEVTLPASTQREFKIYAGSTASTTYYMGNNGTIDEDASNWDFEGGKNNVKLNPGLGGTFIFSIDYSANGGAPKVSVTYPRKTIYLTPGVWNADGAKFAIHYFRDGGSTGWTDFLTANDCGMSAEIPQWNGITIIPVRFNPSDATPGWNGDGHVWNQTNDITLNSNNSVVITGWEQSNFTYGTYAVPTYTISYNKGTNGTGSKANESKTCGVDFTLPGSTFTYAGHTQDGWATVDGGAIAYALSGSYTTNDDEEFFPHWKCNTPTITDNGDNTVTITVPAGTTVRYTTDGTNPTSSTGTVYSSAIDIAANVTVKAIAYQSGCTDSEVASQACTYHAPAVGCIDANSTNFGAGNSSGDASKTLADGTVVAMNKCTNSASSVSIGGNILFTAPTGKAFETFSFVATCGSAGKTNYYKINGGSQQSLESSTTTAKTYTITIPGATNATTIQIIKNGTTPAVSSFCYTFKDICTAPTTAFANGSYTIGGSALDLSTLISSNNSSGAITYTVKKANGTGATIAGTSFTATSAGTATVTATQAANGGHCEKVMDATITVSAAATTYSVTHSLTNVTATSGATGAGAATEGVAYNAVFAANSGYVLPSTITVTIDGSPATVGTGYTWNASTGAFQVPAEQVTGAIVITIAGETAPATKDIYYGAITITAGALTKGSTGTVQFFTNTGGTIANNTEISLSTTLGAGSEYYLSNDLTGAELSKSSNWTTSSSSNRYVQGVKFGSGKSYTLALGSKVASSITFYGINGSASKTMTIGGQAWTSSSTKNTFAKHEFTKSGNFTGNVTISQDGDFYGILVITIQTATPCTTPVIPTLSNQTVCPGSDIAAWNATQTAVLADGETASYSWKKKGNDTEIEDEATLDLGAATESMAGTYVVTVTVSKAGKASSSASAEVDLTVTPATEEPSVTASKAKVYATDEVTLTATCGSTGVTWNWYSCANSDGTGAGSSLGTSATYTIASAPAAGTYYYKAVATGDGTNSCGAAEYVYTLIVSAANSCDKEFWFAKEGDRPTGAAAATHITGCPSGSSSASYTASIDGTNYTLTGSTGQKTGNVTIVVPADNTGTLYVVVQGSSSRTITLSKGGTQIGQETPANSTWGVFTFDDLDAGTYTLVSSGNISWAMMALKLCPTAACTDDTPTATATNATVCAGGSITITATGYETGATFQWQKQNASTSVWENIDGATSDTYTVETAAAEYAGNYHIIATMGCARTSNTVTIAVPSAPVFNSFTTTRTVMATLALSITDVEASDATSYAWYKSADATYDAGSDTRVGTAQELLLAAGGEVAGDTYYLFCVASNSCGSTTSSAIAVNVTAYVDADCAIAGSSGEHNTFSKTGSVSSGTYGSVTELHTNSNNKYLQYVAEDGYYFKTAKVNACVNDASSLPTAAYSYSTDGGANWTDAALPTAMTTAYADHVIDPLPANVNAFRVGRKLGDYGSGSGTLYIHEVCFEYSESCTSTTVTPSGTGSETHTIGDSFTEPTFTVKHGGTAFDPQPEITYTSSNEDIATVDDDGTVNFQGMAGSVTITAAYAGDATYCASEGHYTITVSCSDEAPRIVAASSVDLSDCNSSVVLNAKKQDKTAFAGGTYQWYRDGEAISGATSASYTAVQAGVYTVERTGTGGCTNLSSNSATVTSETVEPEVTKLVPFQYYHVDKTYSDQMKMRHLFAVKGSAAYGSTGKNFKMELSKNGAAATDVTTSNAFSVVKSADNTVETVMIDLNKLNGKYAKDDELVLTCKAVDCEGNVSSTYKDEITIHVIDDTPTLALICSGSSKAGGTRKKKELTVGGDFLTGYNVADLCQQTGSESFDANTEWGLYTRLKENYIVTPVNGYAVFNKLNYEPFDILLLTDYPKADKSDAAATILDDMAALCDYRPMLSFKTHMVKKSPSKWAAKGFTTSPVVSKTDGCLNLNIVCYAHPMFNSLKTGENVYTDVGNTSAPLVYTMLSGTGYESSKGMQGFELAAAENFVTIGLTHYNATIAKDSPSEGQVSWTPGSEDRMLVTVAERQANPEARFILFSLNIGAHSKLTDKGEQVVLACLNYLLGTAEGTIEPADCSFTFDNGENNEHDDAWYANPSNCAECTGTKGDGKWTTAANWGPDYRLLPGEFTSVRIKKPVEVDDTHAHVMEVRIIDEGSIDIPAGKALDVKSTIRRMDGSEIYPTDVNDIHIGSASTGNGTLIFNNNDGDTKARVDMYSTALADVANMSAATSTWQYIGTPHNDIANARSNYYGSWLYQYSGSGWEVIPNGGPLVPFRGYCVTHPDAPVVFDMAGTLVATTSQDIAIPAGYTVIANSWVAPIDITTFTDDDMENISDKTIYFFNTGTDADGTAGTGTAPGTYVAVPKNSASYVETWQIPSMQGFYISTTSDGTLHLDYERHVRPAGGRTIVSKPMYAPRRAAAESDEPEVAKLFFRGHRYHDKLVVLEREDFTRGYDSGWDGEAWGGSDLSPMAYVSIDGRYDAVSAVPEYEGTVIGFRAGEDNECTIDFEYSEENEPLYLYDTETKQYTRVVTGNAYHFTTSDKAYHERFILTRNNPQTPTDIGNGEASGGARAKKFILNDKMYIMINGLLYDATGKVVK